MKNPASKIVTPQRAVSTVNKVLSFPSVVGGLSTAGALLASGPAYAQATEMVAALPPDSLPPWLAPYAPIVIGAVLGGAGTIAAWIIRTLFGTALATLSAGLEAGGAAIEAKAKKTSDISDDAPASALAAAMRAMAARLREAEHDMPTVQNVKRD